MKTRRRDNLKNVLVVLLVGGVSFLDSDAYADPFHNFDSTVVWSAPTAVFSLDTGDLLPLQAGSEVAALDSTGAVYLLTPQPGYWDDQLIVDDEDVVPYMGSRPTVSVGELLSGANGEEVVVMANKHLNVAHFSADGVWTFETIFSSEGMIGSAWGARTGDYIPSFPGEEIFLIYEPVYDESFGSVGYRVGQTWVLDEVYHGQVGMDSAAGEFDSGYPGPEIVIPGEMGWTYLLKETGTPPYDLWLYEVIWQDFENEGWVCQVADVEELNPGNEVVYGTRSTNSILVSRQTIHGHWPELVFTGQNDHLTNNMWDIDTGDILPGGAEEIVGVDDSGFVYLVWREDGQWQGETIWTDASGPVYAVVVDDFDPYAPGDEILVGGYSGNLTLLTRNNVSAVQLVEDRFNQGEISLICLPNPFNPRAMISYQLPQDTVTNLSVFDVAGRLVSILIDGAEQNAGLHSATWNGCDGNGFRMPSGVYFFRLSAAGTAMTKKMTLVR